MVDYTENEPKINDFYCSEKFHPFALSNWEQIMWINLKDVKDHVFEPNIDAAHESIENHVQEMCSKNISFFDSFFLVFFLIWSTIQSG